MRASKRLAAAVAVCCLALAGGTVLGGTAVAKKKKKKGGPVAASAANIAVPAGLTGPPFRNGAINVPLTIGKKAKGKVVSYDGVRFTYQASAASNQHLNDLSMAITAPNGRTIYLDLPEAPSGITAVGPLTLTANTSVVACQTLPATNCDDPDEVLPAPFAGTALSEGLDQFRGLSAKGTWTLRARNIDDQGPVTLNSVRLEVPVTDKPKS